MLRMWSGSAPEVVVRAVETALPPLKTKKNLAYEEVKQAESQKSAPPTRVPAPFFRRSLIPPKRWQYILLSLEQYIFI